MRFHLAYPEMVDSPASAPQRLLLVTGLLGAGKTTALKVLEDLGWEVIDNFPVRLLGRLIDSSDAPPLRMMPVPAKS